MNLSPDEVELIVEWDKLRNAYLAAKADKPGSVAYRNAKAAMSEFRAEWRGVRDAFAGDGARPATIRASATVADKKG